MIIEAGAVAARHGGITGAMAFLDLSREDYVLAQAVLNRAEEQAAERDAAMAQRIAAEVVAALARATRRH